MSYIVIKVYSFECDWPGCDVTNEDVVESTYREALKTLRSTGWTVDLRHGKPQFCPKHDTATVTERNSDG
jgi:hypothetical protein